MKRVGELIFSSLVFIFVFLPVLLFCNFILFKKSRPLQNLLLLFASFIFYAWGEMKLIWVFVLSIILTWAAGCLISKFSDRKKLSRFILTLSVIINVGALFAAKYLVFSVENINSLFGLKIAAPTVAMPLGISFFTFSALSYVIDVYRNDVEAQKNPLYMALYISFFPKLIQGPIVRYGAMADDIINRKETVEDFTQGVSRFIAGLIKKVLIANTIAVIADNAFNSKSEISVAFAWLGALAYTFQIYFDFSGYSDMAIGLGRMLGFHIPENFNYPYISQSVSEFWRRWHISLGTWFKDYVYFPLGGSRVKTKARLIFNLFVVWFLTGVWHGANWTFIAWGLMYFVLITVEKLTKFEKKGEKLGWLKYIYTMLFVVLGWVLFRADSISQAGTYLSSMFGLAGNPLIDDAFIFNVSNNYVFLIAAAVFSFPTAKLIREKIGDKHKSLDVLYVIGVAALLLIAVSYIVKGSYNPFIYFNF
jgi:alginate O-acetyltransferase complex protein AlgI